MNTAFRRVLLPGFLLIFAFCNIVASTLIVSVGDHMFENFGNLVFLVSFAESVMVILFVGTLCGKVNKKSKMFLGQLQRRGFMRMENPVFFKTVRACSPIKVRFGNNFIEILTPFVMMNLCIKWTVKFLLFQYKYTYLSRCAHMKEYDAYINVDFMR